jgi:hypothetical protein
MLLVPKIYAEIAVGFDFLILTTALLFRKSKPKTGISSLDPKSERWLGFYVTGSAIGVLIVGHYAFYTSYLDYFEGLALDALLFYLGLRVVVRE